MRSPAISKHDKNFTEAINAVTAWKGPAMEHLSLKNICAPEALPSKEGM